MKNPVTYFRSKMCDFYIKEAKETKTANIGFNLYDDLLSEVKGSTPKAKYLGTLFGVKIYVDPMLEENEVEFKI